MCLVCIEIAKGSLTLDQARRNVNEMVEAAKWLEDKQHLEKVKKELENVSTVEDFVVKT